MQNFLVIIGIILFFFIAPQIEADQESAPPATSPPPLTSSETNGTTEPPPSEIFVPDQGYWISVGAGMGSISTASTTQDLSLGWDYHLGPKYEFGPYYKKVALKYPEDQYFENTGYTETRSYNVVAQLYGIQLKSKLKPARYLQFGVGLCTTTSKIDSVQTDAPLASTSGGTTKGFSPSIGLEIGYLYRFEFNRFNLGLNLGFFTTSTNVKESYSEVSAGVNFEFKTGHIVKSEDEDSKKSSKVPLPEESQAAPVGPKNQESTIHPTPAETATPAANLKEDKSKDSRPSQVSPNPFN